MPEALRWLFLGIVLLDLAFVQLTGTVTSPWLWALWSCAAATPLPTHMSSRALAKGEAHHSAGMLPRTPVPARSLRAAAPAARVWP